MAASVANGPVAADAHQFQRRRREAAEVLILHQRQISLAELFVSLMMVPSPPFHDLMRLLLTDADTRDVSFHGDPSLFNDFRRWISLHVLNLLQEARYYDADERVISEAFPHIVLRAARQAAGLIPRDQETTLTREMSSDAVFAHLQLALQAAGLVVPPPDDDEATQLYYPNGGGFGAVPASAAAVGSLEKQTFFHAAGGNCDDITECGICFDEFVDGGQVSVMPCPCRGHRFHPDCITKWLAISNMCPLCRYELLPAGK